MAFDFYWKGGTYDTNGKERWDNKLNWAIGSPTGLSGTSSNDWPGYNYTAGYIGYRANVFITKNASIVNGSTYFAALENVTIGGTGTNQIDFSLTHSVDPGDYLIYGNLTVKNCRSFVWQVDNPSSEMVLYKDNSTTATIDTGGFIFNTSVTLKAATYNTGTWKLLSDVTIPSDKFFSIYRVNGLYETTILKLNGYGLTVPVIYTYGLNRDGTHVFEFTPREDNDPIQQPAKDFNSGLKNNLSYIYFTNLINNPKVTSDSDRGDPIIGSRADYIDFVGIGQRPICVIGCAPEVKAVPIADNTGTAVTSDIGYGFRDWRNANLSPKITVETDAVQSQQDFNTAIDNFVTKYSKKIVDWYIIDEHPNSWASYRIVADQVHGTIDLTGKTPGDNVPAGPGCTKQVIYCPTDTYPSLAFTGHILLNSGQELFAVASINSNLVQPYTASTTPASLASPWFIHKPRIRRNTIKGWKELNPVLGPGEIGWEFDPSNTNLQDQFKVGISTTSTWNSLQYAVKNTAKGWSTSTNLLKLAQGQVGWECDTNKLKIGTGNALWKNLSYSEITTDNQLIDYPDHPSYDQGLGDGWIIDFQNNSLLGKNPTTYNNYWTALSQVLADQHNTSLISKKNTKLYFLSSFDSKWIFVRGEDASSTIFLVGDSKLVFVAGFFHLRGTISTVYGDGFSSKIVTKLADTTVWRSNYLKEQGYSASLTTTYFVGFYLRGGNLELYEPNSIKIPYTYYKTYGSFTLIPGYFEVSNISGISSSIDFYFFKNLVDPQGTPFLSYTDGIIQTDYFNQVGPLNIRMYSDKGNLVTTSADENPDYSAAITVTWKGFGQEKGTTAQQPGYLIGIPSYRTGTVWRERTDLISVLSTSSITLKSYQYDQYYGLNGYGGLYAYLDENIMFPAGPLIVKVSGQNGYYEETRLIVAQSSSTYFIIDTTTGGPVAFLSGYDTITASNITPKVAGLDLTLTQGPNAYNTLYFWNAAQLFNAAGSTFYVTNNQGGHIFSRDAIRFPRNLTGFDLTGGSENLPARIGVPKLYSETNGSINLTINGGYYTIDSNTVSAGSLNLASGTLNQTLNASVDFSPEFSSVNLDASTLARTFIHGLNESVGNPVAFYISGQSGNLWQSGGTGLTITTLNTTTNEPFAPSVIDFKGTFIGDVYIYPGNLSNFSAPMTPDQSALTFSFNKNSNTPRDIYILNNSTDAMCVQTLLLGYYDNGSWIGCTGTIRINRDLVFCGNKDVYNNNSLFSDITIQQYLGIIQDQYGYQLKQYSGGFGNGTWNYSDQYGGLNLGPNSILVEANNAQLFFQGQGEVVFGNPTVTSDIPIVNFGSATYKNTVQYNYYNPSIGQTYNKNYAVTPWTIVSHPIITNYNIRGYYGNLNILSGKVAFDYLRVNTNDYSNTVTVFSLLIKGNNQNINSATVQLYGIDLRILNTLTTYNNTSTSLVASYPSSLSFANTNQFNANLNQYLNISIGTWRASIGSPVPVLTINPCASDATDGSPLIDVPSSVTLGDLKASDVGPSIFQFTPGTTSTFINFTYTDTSAPFNTTASWYAYANTLSNTVLRSSQLGQSWNISIPTPHRGTIREKHVVSNFTIQDSNALQEYIWFAPGTVNVSNTGKAYQEGYVSGSNVIRGASVDYYNYNNGRNTGWVFHEPPSASMDLSFWSNPPYEVLGESKDSYYYNTFYGQSWSSTNFVTPGSYPWIAPAGVYSITVTAIGGGGGGSVAGGAKANTGGGGGGLAWATNVPVVPGQSYTVVVGAGGTANNSGGDSYFQRPQSYLEVRGLGGKSGTSATIATVTLVGGSGGTSTFQTTGTGIVTGGGFGGAGGTYTFANSGAYGSNTAGGGAGGYMGNGGKGQDNSGVPFDGLGQGGGGAGGSVSTGTTRGGGGTGLYGEGVSGLVPNGGGSGGSASNLTNGGLYGGGGAGVASGTGVSQGGNGAVRISWPGFFGPK